jgi:hypothetical protein
MTTHWLLRIGDGEHFKRSTKFNLWGIESSNKTNNKFIKEAQKGDLLWFVRSKGMLLGMATYVGQGPRVLGPIVNLSMTNEELGWTDKEGKWDIEVHYKDLYDLEYCEMYTGIRGACVIRPYNEKCLLNIPEEYEQIVKYSRAKKI